MKAQTQPNNRMERTPIKARLIEMGLRLRLNKNVEEQFRKTFLNKFSKDCKEAEKLS